MKGPWPWAAAIIMGAAVLSGSGIAAAHPSYKTAIPNGSVSNCATCHLAGADYLRNEFGLALEPLALALEPLEEWWPAVRDLDSDLDGQSNAQELGDPCLTFAMGMAPDRTTSISNPGVLASVSMDPDACEDPPVGEGEGEGEPEPDPMEEPADETTPEPDEGTDDDVDRWKDPQWQGPAPKTKGCSASGGDDSSQLGWWLLAAGLALVTRALRRGEDDEE